MDASESIGRPRPNRRRGKKNGRIESIVLIGGSLDCARSAIGGRVAVPLAVSIRFSTRPVRSPFIFYISVASVWFFFFSLFFIASISRSELAAPPFLAFNEHLTKCGAAVAVVAVAVVAPSVNHQPL